MTTEEFKTAFLVGSLISYVTGMQFLKAGVRDFFKIEGHTVNPKNMYSFRFREFVQKVH